MAQLTLPPGRVGAVEQERAYATDALLEAGSAGQVGGAVKFLIENQARLMARNAAKEASARIFAAQNFR